MTGAVSSCHGTADEVRRASPSLVNVVEENDRFRAVLRLIARRGCAVLGGPCRDENACPACLAAAALQEGQP